MTITAKYASKCPHCGQTIQPGEQVEWTRGTPAAHTRCPAAAPVAAPARRPGLVSAAEVIARRKAMVRRRRGGGSFLDDGDWEY